VTASAGFLNLGSPDITGEPEVRSFTRPDGRTIAIVDLGANGHLTMHLDNANGARALAAAFTRAADLIQAAEGNTP
jgi:hypothetical protein